MITDVRVLDPEFLPNDVVQRDTEINLLSSVLRPAVEGTPSDSAVLHGALLNSGLDQGSRKLSRLASG